MRLQPSTIVFAGAAARDMPMLERAGVDAIMLSWEKLRGDKKLQARIREGLSPTWKPILYLDSGVFTLMRRAGVTSFAPTRAAGSKDAIKKAIQELARSYDAYLRENAQYWDWIIELDTDEAYGAEHYADGIELADKLRAHFRGIVGDKLLPVWHAPRGPENWRQLIREYPYVCISPSRALGGKSNRRNHSLIRGMVAEARSVGTAVHLLGASSPSHFEDFEVDTMDSSGWSAGVRWGELKVNRGKVMLPKFETRHRRPLVQSHLSQVEDLVAQWGFTLDQVRNEYLIRIEVGIRLLLMRQEYIRQQRSAREVVIS